MDQLFLQILDMSITTSYVILFVIVARFLLKKTPKIFSYALWLVVLFRFLCPFSFESIFSLIPANTQTVPQNIMYSNSPQVNSGITVINQVVKSSTSASDVSAKMSSTQFWFTLAELVWVLGVIVLLVYSIFTAIKLYRKLKSAKFISDNIYEVASIKTPFVFGIIKPKIYLPNNLNEHERAYILKHEQTHIKRYDYIVKPLAYFALCIHWFNPLAWVAFFLMCEDMELSCDESVIKQMGSDIKKDYTTSLLSLSTGRRNILTCPLAFGENNTKGRIVNVLNYKKPAFWVTVVAIVAVVVACVGLMSDPKKEQFTVDDYANQFVEKEINAFNDNKKSDIRVADKKITKLEKMASFDTLYSSPLEIWSLEYRLKLEETDKVMLPGGRNMVDGWITEDTSRGKPILVFSRKKSQLQYLGCIWSGEGDFTTIAQQETAVRIFLESIKLLPHETYKGNHIVMKFTTSSGETAKLLLSQPAKQGKAGIWCVERWKDTNGNVYYVTPKTDKKTIDYYNEMQKQCDDGNKTSLLDPLQVATNFTKNDKGLNIVPKSFDTVNPAMIEDFAKTPESHFVGFILNFSTDKPSFHFDQVEWLTDKDTERLKELKISPVDMPNGYYIHNPVTYPMYCEVNKQTKYNIVDWKGKGGYKTVNKEEFDKYLKEYKSSRPPFRIVTQDGYVQSITEQFLP
ncbi:M56 family metallopeptidase [Clostridiaceae bacterium M8S5]|nr:M56 family metallopeptidase [Clostridiaceae bacterium M8S5]